MTRFCPQCDARFDADVRTCPADGSQTYLVGGADSMIGRRIDGRFTITGVLGSGGMGAVYRALQHSIDRDIALKLLRPEFLSDENAVRRFFREARAASRLSNPHTITVFDFGQSSDGQFYIAMELLRGRPLSVVLESEAQPMDPVRAVRLVDQVLESLEEAHREGVLHRDLKTDNVFVLDDPPNFVKVLDFGLAKIARGDDSVVTEAGTTFGTPAFMSPEQACGKHVDARGDLYSIGVLLFELLAGRLPFDDTSSIAVILKKVQETAPTVARVTPSAKVPAALEKVLARLLAIEPKERPGTATETRVLLRGAVGLEAPGQETPSGMFPRPGLQSMGVANPPRGTPTLPDPPAAPRPALDGKALEAALATLARAADLASEGETFYSTAAGRCTSRPAQDLFGALLSGTHVAAADIRQARERAGQGAIAWGARPAGTGDPAGVFEASVRANVGAIQADAQFARALDAGLAFERRVVDFWERQSMDGRDRLDPSFARCRLAQAKDHVAILAEIKLRVLGLVRGAGFNSLYMRLAGEVPVRRVRSGEALFRQGDPGDAMVVVVSGRFRLEMEGRPGRPLVLGEIGPGDVVGEMTCLDPAPRSATVTALADSEVCTIDRGTLGALRDGDPATYVAVLRAVVSQVADRVRDTDRRVEELSRALQVNPRARGAVEPRDGSMRGGGGGPADSSRATRGCNFNANDLRVLEQVTRRRAAAPGEWVCREGEIGDACFVLKSGRLEIVKQVDGAELVLATLSEGSVAGQIALVDRGPRSASVRAVGPCELLVLDRVTFERLVDAHVPLALRFQEQIAVTGIRQLRLADQWLATLMTRREALPPSAPSVPIPPPSAKPVVAPAPRVPPQAAPQAASRIPARPPRPGDDDEASRQVLDYMRTALREWGMSLEDLDSVAVVPPADLGTTSARARRPRAD